MSTPSPADLMRRHPSGSPGSRGGQFQERSNDAPATTLVSGLAASPNDLPIPDLVDEVPEWVTDADTLLRAEYRGLWKRMNAKHRSTTYGAADHLSGKSEDPAELAILGQFQGPGVALNVARNPATPACVLHMIAVGESGWRDPEARRAAVSHPNCPEATIRIVWAHRKVRDYQGIGKSAIPTAPNTPFDVLDEAAAEGDVTALARLADAAG